MQTEVFAMWFMLPIILLVEAALVRFLWHGEMGSIEGVRRVMGSLSHNAAGIALIVVLWVALTAVAWVYEFVFGQVLLYMLLFSAGRFAAFLGLMVFAAILVYTPVACAGLLMKMCRQTPAGANTLPPVTG